MKNLKIIATVAIVAFFTSCSNPENGINGTNGTDGSTGATGTANVIYSAWLNAPAALPETIDETNGVSTFIVAPELSAEILAKGTILTYMSYSSATNPLPYTTRSGGKINTITFIASLNKIKFFRFYHDGSTGSVLPTHLKWRYILIPGGVAASGKHSNVDYSKMSYEEVCTHLNIQP